MTRTQALTIARRLYGKSAMVRENRHPSSPERREEAARRVAEAKARLDAIEVELKERLAALPWYVALTDERTRLTKVRNEARGWIHYYRCIIGLNMGFACSVKAEGDTWAEATADAQAKKVAP
jgi:hypothetical protein